MATTKQTFGAAQEAREYLVSLGFAPFRKGLTKGEFTANGRRAQLGMCIPGRTGQSSTGAGWAYVVTVEGAYEANEDDSNS